MSIVWANVWDPNRYWGVVDLWRWSVREVYNGRESSGMGTCIGYYMYIDTSLSQPTIGPTLNGPSKEVVGLGS